MNWTRNHIFAALAFSAVAALSAAQDPSHGHDRQEDRDHAAAVAAAEFRSRVIRAANDYKEGKNDEAFAKFQDLYHECPHDPDVEGWLGFLLLIQKRGADAIPLLEDACAQRPNDLEVMNNLGNAYYLQGDYEKALGEYKAIIQIDPTIFVPHYNCGNIYLRKQDYVHALVEYRKAAAQHPDDCSIQNDLGVAYERLKDDANASECFQKASDLQPGDPVLARNAGLALYRIRQYDTALPYLLRADAHDPSIGLALGEIYSRQGKQSDALRCYEGVSGGMSGNSAFWFNLGVIKANAGDNAGAEEDYRRCLEIAPTDLDANTNLGLLLFNKGDFHGAEAVFQKLVGLEPNSVTARMDLGSSAAKCGDFPGAIDAWRSVIRENPHDVSVRLSLAEVYYETGDYQDSEHHFSAALAERPNSARALNGMGLLHLHGSHLAEAEAAFRGSISADSRFVPAYNNLAVTLERMNRKEQAVSVLQEALRIDPSDESSRQNLERLRAER